RLRLPGPESRRPLARVPAPPPTPQPPGDNISELPSHQNAPQSSGLYKSLYGLPQCLRSQADVPVSSLHSGDAPNTPVFNQAESNSNPASDSNTIGAANGSVNNPEQNLNSDAHEIDDLGLDLLDSDSLVQLGTRCFAILVRRESRTANEGPSQNYIPNSVSFLPNVPVPLPMQLDEPGAHGDLPVAHDQPISGTEIQPQSHFPASNLRGPDPNERPPASASASQLRTGAFYGEEGSFVHPNGHERAFPDKFAPSQPAASSSGYNGVNSAVTPSSSFNDIGPHLHNFQATGPDPQLSPPGEVNQIPNPNPRACQ
ncbi:hypothetical protein FRC11_002714, partial [Ceratobasidium sp. 423]